MESSVVSEDEKRITCLTRDDEGKILDDAKRSKTKTSKGKFKWPESRISRNAPDIEPKKLEYTCYVNSNCDKLVLVWEIKDETDNFSFPLDSQELFKGRFSFNSLGGSLTLKITSLDSSVVVKPQEIVLNTFAYDEELHYESNFLITSSEKKNLQGKSFMYEISGESCNLSMHFIVPLLPDDKLKSVATPLPSKIPKDKESRKNIKVSKTISRKGGKIEFEDYNHCYIEFPPGAVDEDVEFKIILLMGTNDKKDGELILTPTLDCSPSMTFKKPVTISLPTCYKPDNSEVEVVPQSRIDYKWNDEETIEHGGKQFIVFQAQSFSRWRIRAKLGFHRRFPFGKKSFQYICYQNPNASKICLTWCIQENINKFKRKLEKGELFRGIITLKSSNSLKLCIECQDNSFISVRPNELEIDVKFEDELFWENNFLVEAGNEFNDSVAMLHYYIRDATRHIRDGSFPLSLIVESTKGNEQQQGSKVLISNCTFTNTDIGKSEGPSYTNIAAVLPREELLCIASTSTSTSAN